MHELRYLPFLSGKANFSVLGTDMLTELIWIVRFKLKAK